MTDLCLSHPRDLEACWELWLVVKRGCPDSAIPALLEGEACVRRTCNVRKAVYVRLTLHGS